MRTNTIAWSYADPFVSSFYTPYMGNAQRLPNGNTLVAENTRVREFDRRGNEVWKKEMTWAVEVNRY